METYPLDISADQAVAWLLAEARTGRVPGSITCTQDFVTQDIPPAPELHLGDVEREDLNEVVAVGVLELRPERAEDGWVFRIRVEDSLNRRLPQDAPAGEGPQDLTVETFNQVYVAAERGVTFVQVEAADEAARARFQPLLDDMQTNRHRG